VCVIREDGWHTCRGFNELTLADLLNDPLIQLLMASDGVDVPRLRALLTGIARRSVPHPLKRPSAFNRTRYED
jgi:hypothetical protein